MLENLDGIMVTGLDKIKKKATITQPEIIFPLPKNFPSLVRRATSNRGYFSADNRK